MDKKKPNNQSLSGENQSADECVGSELEGRDPQPGQRPVVLILNCGAE